MRRDLSLLLSLLTLASLSASACGGDDVLVKPPAADASADAAGDATMGTDAAPVDAAVPMDASDAGDAQAAPMLKHVFFIMMENHGTQEIIGNTADAPYINELASKYGLATSYFGVTHPSLPNYLAMFSGDFQGIWDDCKAGQSVTCAPEEFVADAGDPTSAVDLTPEEIDSASKKAHWFDGQNLVDQLEAKGLSWKGYMQSIPSVGATDEYAPVDVVDGGQVARKLYAQKHDPFMYFSNVRNAPARMQKIVPFTQLATDLASAAATPTFVWISPDQCHDMHGVSMDNATALGIPDCAYPSSGLDHKVIALGDQFLKDTVNAIMASPAWGEGSVIAIAWDEDDYEGTAGCCGSPTGMDGGVLGGANAPAIVIPSANAKPVTDSTPYNHYAMLATVQKVLGLGCLANTCNFSGSQLMTKLFLP